MSKSAGTAAKLDELLRPPTEAEVDHALGRFGAAVSAQYGSRLKGLYLFGSRARGENRPDSDADVAVVLEDGDWIPWKERWLLNMLAYEAGLERGVVIQPWPFPAMKWDARQPRATKLVEAAYRDAIPIRIAQ